MFDNCKISFIGSGAMAEAMISGLIRNRMADPGSLFASDPRKERLAELEHRYRIQSSTDNKQVIVDADLTCLWHNKCLLICRRFLTL